MNTEYAIKNNCLTHISEVEHGLKCDCICPSCNEKMVARKGSKMAHHFAHQNTECSYGVETTLHLMAKTILEQEKKILLPEVTVPFLYKKPVISKAKIIEFEEVFLEKRLNEMIPDILIKIDNKLLMIEIWVTHKIDDVKRKKITDSGISTFEINLSGFDRMIGIEHLKKIFLEESECKQWVYNHMAINCKLEWLSICEAKQTVRRGLALHVDMCPINARVWRGKSYANVIDDCTGCGFFMESIVVDNGKNDYSDDEFIYCSGKANVQTVAELKNYIKKKKAVNT